MNNVIDKELKNIKKIENEWGYNVYYSLKNKKITYNLELAKEKMKQSINNYIDRDLYNYVENMLPREIEFTLRKYDYRKRAINENSKSMVVFIAFSGEILSKIAFDDSPKKNTAQMLEWFTNHEISFGELVEYGHRLATNHSDNFFNSFMDYLMNVILEKKY